MKSNKEIKKPTELQEHMFEILERPEKKSPVKKYIAYTLFAIASLWLLEYKFMEYLEKKVPLVDYGEANLQAKRINSGEYDIVYTTHFKDNDWNNKNAPWYDNLNPLISLPCVTSYFDDNQRVQSWILNGIDQREASNYYLRVIKKWSKQASDYNINNLVWTCKINCLNVDSKDYKVPFRHVFNIPEWEKVFLNTKGFQSGDLMFLLLSSDKLRVFDENNKKWWELLSEYIPSICKKWINNSWVLQASNDKQGWWKNSHNPLESNPKEVIPEVNKRDLLLLTGSNFEEEKNNDWSFGYIIHKIFAQTEYSNWSQQDQDNIDSINTNPNDTNLNDTNPGDTTDEQESNKYNNWNENSTNSTWSKIEKNMQSQVSKRWPVKLQGCDLETKKIWKNKWETMPWFCDILEGNWDREKKCFPFYINKDDEMPLKCADGSRLVFKND